ncbi:hypothetical protein [Pseudooceanicola sp. LIPI14-2-Ac024]|uniref:hypothetical protein n=1 Tax=Pseudooceanicola sp. LIPI14-2-Ac024 TaxID=3344875 RepID=UPI0035CFEF33
MSDDSFGVERSDETIVPRKSLWIALGLTVLFGPVGLFYSTIVGGIFMTSIAVIIIGVTRDTGVLLIWPVCIAWGLMEAVRVPRSHRKFH